MTCHVGEIVRHREINWIVTDIFQGYVRIRSLGTPAQGGGLVSHMRFGLSGQERKGVSEYETRILDRGVGKFSLCQTAYDQIQVDPATPVEIILSLVGVEKNLYYAWLKQNGLTSRGVRRDDTQARYNQALDQIRCGVAVHRAAKEARVCPKALNAYCWEQFGAPLQQIKRMGL